MTHAYLLAGIYALHLLEEQALLSFRHWFNRWVFRSGADQFPLSSLMNGIVNIGLLSVLMIGLSLASVASPWTVSVFLGVIGLDAVLHIVLSFTTRKFSPGAATSLLYLWLAYHELAKGWHSGSWYAGMALGALILGSSYLLAWYRVSRAKRAGTFLRPAENN